MNEADRAILRGEVGPPLPDGYYRPGAHVPPKPELIRAWLAGEIDTAYAIVLGSFDPDPAVRVWAETLIEVQTRTPADVIRMTSIY